MNLCGVPIAELGQWLRKGNSAWFLDHLARDRNQPWARCTAADLRDGIELVLDASKGGYESEIGWNPRSVEPVAVVTPPELPLVSAGSSPDEDVAVADEPASLADAWYPLAAHLIDVERECTTLLEAFGAVGLSAEMQRAAIVAGRLHDIGKASDVWQQAALATGKR